MEIERGERRTHQRGKGREAEERRREQPGEGGGKPGRPAHREHNAKEGGDALAARELQPDGEEMADKRRAAREHGIILREKIVGEQHDERTLAAIEKERRERE